MQTIAIAAGAVVLFAVSLIGALAFTGGSSSGGSVHTMPGGQTMTQRMMNGTRTMQDGQSMPGMTHGSP